MSHENIRLSGDLQLSILWVVLNVQVIAFKKDRFRFPPIHAVQATKKFLQQNVYVLSGRSLAEQPDNTHIIY